jgi:hypothetical protein
MSPPLDQFGNPYPSGGSGYGSGQSENGKSPLSMSLGFLKNLTEKKNTRGVFAYALPSAPVTKLFQQWTDNLLSDVAPSQTANRR